LVPSIKKFQHLFLILDTMAGVLEHVPFTLWWAYSHLPMVVQA